MTRRVLVIRLGALGDLTLCFQAFADIRAAHPTAHIALLTMPAFAEFARLLPWFDEIITDPRPPLFRSEWWQLLHKIRKFRPDCVYDLQGKFRQDAVFYALGGLLWGPKWSGAALGCSYPRLWPPQPSMHFTDFIAAQLQRAGIATGTPLDLSWLDAPIDKFVEGRVREGGFVLLIPGCAPNRPYKRWPAENYAALANHFHDQGLTSLAIGTKQDADAIADIRTIAPHVIDLGGQTSLAELAGLARKAAFVVGNDTGPTHIAAAVGGRVLALMSDQVNPIWSAPKGVRTHWLQGKPLARLKVLDISEHWQMIFDK